MCKKHHIFTCISVVLPLCLYSQSISRSVVGNFAQTAQAEGFRVTLALGESIASRQYFEDGTGSVSAGYLRPYFSHPTLPRSAAELLYVQVSANPVKTILNFTINTSSTTSLSCWLTDVSGRILVKKEGIRAGVSEIGMESFPAGVYFLSVRSKNMIVTEKVVKAE